MDVFEQRERDACARVATLLARPDIPGDDQMYSSGECFEPWDLFPSLYGSYSSDFDDMAIEVLKDIRDRTHNRTDLAGEMFREMLCTQELCDYGTSPRVCFASTGFKSLLPTLIERWARYRKLKWE